MLKFLFCSANEPAESSWDYLDGVWETPEGHIDSPLKPLYHALWDWHRGDSRTGENRLLATAALSVPLIGNEFNRQKIGLIRIV